MHPLSKLTSGIWTTQSIQGGAGILSMSVRAQEDVQKVLSGIHGGKEILWDSYEGLSELIQKIEGQLIYGERFALIRTFPGINSYPVETFEQFVSSFIRQIGTPLSQSDKGELICQVRNHNVDYSDPNARGHKSNQEILPHTDTGDAFCLFTLSQGMHGGTTYFVNTRQIFNTILEEKPDFLSCLFDSYPNYRKIEDTHIADEYYDFPIYVHHDNEVSCSFNTRLIREGLKKREGCIPPFRLEALQYFENLLYREDLRVGIKLQPGECVICSNYDVIHYRDSFQDSHDRERLLLRVWFNLHRPRNLPDYFSSITRRGIPLEESLRA
jgi:alpha-ketoglutarate-dependent taurine dioxygenase